MATNAIFKRVQQMRPSSFSEEERCHYQAEKMMVRQFLLLKQQNQVPDHISVGQMKTWLLTARNFMEEFEEMINDDGGLETRDLLMVELAWTTARRFCIDQMEQEVQEELEEERRLSRLLNRDVTMEGLEMFVAAFLPKIEETVRAFMLSLLSKLMQHFGRESEDAKPRKLLQFQQTTAPVIEEIMYMMMKFLLEEAGSSDRVEAASSKVGRLLSSSTAPFLAQYGPLSKELHLGVCSIAAKFMVKSILGEFNQRSQSFRIMDHDESLYSARDSVIIAVKDMDHGLQTTPCSPQPQQSPSETPREGLLEEQEASPEVSSNEVTVTTNSASRLETNVVVYMEPEIEVLQEDLEAEDTGAKRKVKKRKTAREFFRGIWRAMSCCFHCPSQD